MNKNQVACTTKKMIDTKIVEWEDFKKEMRKSHLDFIALAYEDYYKFYPEIIEAEKDKIRREYVV